ncbi:MAG: hypothetical protein EOO15_17985 [Chitinophagaceae bacterium]|nr:MAG: hypothetical protein EOO15_17985 [Chitinophagaceae bacterium]
MIQYYQRPFLFLHSALDDKKLRDTISLRRSFFILVPEKRYDFLNGRELILEYFKSLERKLKPIIEKYSIAYWLHVSRRILPNSPGSDKSPETIVTLRDILTAAILKYGQLKFCNYVGNSKQIDISEVFDGLLLGDEFNLERQLLELGPEQLVLRRFNQMNLEEYYQVERCCYEIWYCLAKLRGL